MESTDHADWLQTGFKWTAANYFDVDSRGIAFSSFFLPPAKLGGGSFYLGALADASGQPLRGANTYRLHVPAHVPVSQFWALTVYNGETSALFLNLTHPTLDSIDKGIHKNADGSVNIYIGPKTPADEDSNWISPRQGRVGSRGFDSMARRRRSSTRAGRCRTLR